MIDTKTSRLAITTIAGLGVGALLLVGGCAASTNTSSATSSSSESETVEEAAPAVLELEGAWTQTNSNSPDNYMAADITGDVLTINWEIVTEDMSAMYWVGTFVAPTDDSEPYTWTSVRDQVATATALLAAQVDSKDFTYSDGKLSFDVTIQGTTVTVEMVRD